MPKSAKLAKMLEDDSGGGEMEDQIDKVVFYVCVDRFGGYCQILDVTDNPESYA